MCQKADSVKTRCLSNKKENVFFLCLWKRLKIFPFKDGEVDRCFLGCFSIQEDKYIKDGAHFETGLTSCFFVFSSLRCKTHAVDIMHRSVSLTAYPPFDHRESWSLSQLSHPGQVTSPSCTHTHTHGLETFNLARMSPDWGRKSGENPRRDRQKMQTMQKGPGSPGCSKEKPRCERTVLTSAPCALI